MSTPTDIAITQVAIKKSAVRLVPFLALLYAMNYLDRVNIGFAAADMKVSIGLSTAAFGLGAGLFFIGYCIFELPSNLMLHRFGARIWIARIVVSWGILSAMMSLVRGETSFYILRVLLGIAEAGLLPGIVLYLTLWFPTVVRGRLTALFFLALPVSMAIGAPLSNWIIEMGDGLFGLEGWQVMFIVQGVPCAAIGLVVFLWLPNGPHEAKWLSPTERHALQAELEADANSTRGFSSNTVRDMFKDVRIYMMAAIIFACTFGINAFSFFMPQVIADFEAQFGTDLTATQTAFLTSVPFAFAAVTMWVLSRSSDRHGERTYHAAGAMLTVSIATVAAVYAPSPYLKIAALSILISAAMSAIPILWQIPKGFLSGAAAAAGIGLIGAIANSSGFFAPTMTGWLRGRGDDFDSSMIAIASVVLAGVVVVLVLGRMLRADAKHQQHEQQRSEVNRTPRAAGQK